LSRGGENHWGSSGQKLLAPEPWQIRELPPAAELRRPWFLKLLGVCFRRFP
jgi:hypothetical protein